MENTNEINQSNSVNEPLASEPLVTEGEREEIDNEQADTTVDKRGPVESETKEVTPIIDEETKKSLRDLLKSIANFIGSVLESAGLIIWKASNVAAYGAKRGNEVFEAEKGNVDARENSRKSYEMVKEAKQEVKQPKTAKEETKQELEEQANEMQGAGMQSPIVTFDEAQREAERQEETNEMAVGHVGRGKIQRVAKDKDGVAIGLIVKLPNGREGLLHKNKISDRFVKYDDKTNSFSIRDDAKGVSLRDFNVGDEIIVAVKSIKESGKIEFSHKEFEKEFNGKPIGEFQQFYQCTGQNNNEIFMVKNDDVLIYDEGKQVGIISGKTGTIKAMEAGSAEKYANMIGAYQYYSIQCNAQNFIPSEAKIMERLERASSLEGDVATFKLNNVVFTIEDKGNGFSTISGQAISRTGAVISVINGEADAFKTEEISSKAVAEKIEKTITYLAIESANEYAKANGLDEIKIENDSKSLDETIKVLSENENKQVENKEETKQENER